MTRGRRDVTRGRRYGLLDDMAVGFVGGDCRLLEEGGRRDGPPPARAVLVQKGGPAPAPPAPAPVAHLPQRPATRARRGVRGAAGGAVGLPGLHTCIRVNSSVSPVAEEVRHCRVSVPPAPVQGWGKGGEEGEGTAGRSVDWRCRVTRKVGSVPIRVGGAGGWRNGRGWARLDRLISSPSNCTCAAGRPAREGGALRA